MDSPTSLSPVEDNVDVDGCVPPSSFAPGTGGDAPALNDYVHLDCFLLLPSVVWCIWHSIRYSIWHLLIQNTVVVCLDVCQVHKVRPPPPQVLLVSGADSGGDKHPYTGRRQRRVQARRRR